MFKLTNLILGISAVAFFGMGICLSESLESNLAYWISYGLFIISSALNIKMFKNNPIHKKLGWIGMIIATVIIGLIAAYLVVTEPEIIKLFQQQQLNKLDVVNGLSDVFASLLFTYSLFLLSFVVSNIEK